MTKKIVAIGGGENGRVTLSGEKKPYELREIDNEIVNLTEKKSPNFLFLGHAQTKPEFEKLYFDTMKAIYGDMFGCECKTVTRTDMLQLSKDRVESLIDWADIIYEGGGDTKAMFDLWKATGLDKMLEEAWNDGKVLCGVSAGANCWFSSCSSDSLKAQLNDDTAPLISVDCLGLVNAFFTPHYDAATQYTNRSQHMKEALKTKDIVGIGISNCCAIEIIDDTYRLLRCDASNYGIEAYGVKAFYKDGEYICEQIDTFEEFNPLDSLLRKS